MLVREMPVLAAARIIEITDKRLWRIVEHYVGRASSASTLASSPRSVWMRPRPGADRLT